MIRSVTTSFFLLLGALAAGGAELDELFQERLGSVAAIEFTIQTEVDRRPVFANAVVVDAEGTLLFPGAAILPGLAPEQLIDFKVYRPGSDEGVPALYLGQDALTGFHFARVSDKEFVARLTPVSARRPRAAPLRLGEEVWGIGLRGKDEDFAPYLLSSRVAHIARLPNLTAITAHEVAGPGLPVFDSSGDLVGLGLNSFGQNFLLFSRMQHANPVVLVNAEESSVVLALEEFLPHMRRVPDNAVGRPIAWMGVYGVQPLDPEVAKLLQLERKGGLVLSDIMQGSPADRAGLRDRDIVVAVDGAPLPRLKPDRVLPGFFGQEILKRKPGAAMRLTVLRDGQKVDVEVTLGDEPKMVREAARRYFERLGVTVREFLAADSILHRAAPSENAGVVVHFVKPDSPAAAAGLRPDDWIREVGGVEVEDFAAAVHQLEKIDRDAGAAEIVLLTRRGGETQVLRIKLN